MLDLFAIQISEYSIEFPQTPFAILVGMLWLVVILLIAIRNRNRDLKLEKKTLLWMTVLSLSVLLFAPFFGILLNPIASDSETSQLMLFAALPWMVAGGIVGVLPAVFLAGLSGLLMAYLQSQHIFMPLVFMTTALLFSLCIRQRYRGFIFNWLRFPIIAALMSVLAVIPLQFMTLILLSSGELQLRVIEGMNILPGDVLSFGGMVLIDGVLCIFIKMAAGGAWETHVSIKPGPSEKSLRFIVLVILFPIFILFSVVLSITQWISAEKTVRRQAIQELTTTSNVVSEGLSVFIDTGEVLIARFAADDRLVTQDSAGISRVLAEKMKDLPYFDLLAVLDLNGDVIAVYPTDAINDQHLVVSEVMERISQQTGAGESQLFTISTSSEDGNIVSISNFLFRISDSSETVKGILWGQARLDSHYIMLPAISDLNSFSANDGIGQIVENDGAVIYQTGSNGGMGTYTGNKYPTATFIEGQSINGESVMQYYRPFGDKGWAVVTSLPKQALQRQVLEMVSPSVLVSTMLLIVVSLVVFLVLSSVDKSIRYLETATEKAALGNFEDNVLDDKKPKGVTGALWDSVQSLITSLEKYQSRRSDLLTLTQQLSDQLSLNDSLKIILMAALERGLSSARILLTDGAAQAEPIVPLYRIGLGEHTSAMASLDDDILMLIRERGELVLRDFQIGKLVNVRKEMPYPASVIALPLEWKGSKLGVFWGTFHGRRHPEANDIEFFKELSKKAALSMIKAQEGGEFIESHARLEGVLNVLNDPVLISDSYGRIVFLNDAAQSLVENKQGGYMGRMLSTVFQNETLLSLIRDAEEQSQSMELQFPEGKTYHVIAHSTQIEDCQRGVVALFTDITPYKKRDALRNEFVTTASHELRSPLTLIHGYAKILRLTGNLNEQQDKYVQNIVESVEEMRNLVQNLLSLGRLESGEALVLEEVTTDAIAQYVMEGLEAQAGQKNIHLEIAIPDPPILFEADSAFLKLALRNLVDNAIKFTKMGGDVTLSVRKMGNNVIFKIQDTGIGISPLDQRQIFNKFHKVNVDGYEAQQGGGLGLAIVKSIAERHHGKVWVESQLGKGSTFYLQIPLKHS